MANPLIVIDVQNDYFPRGANPLPRSLAALENVKKAIAKYRAQGEAIIYIQHLSVRAGANFFAPGTVGAEIHNEIAPNANDAIVEKNYPNSFFKTNLEEILSALNAEKLTICGMMTQMCVDATVRAAKEKGYEIELIEDACAANDMKYKDETISADLVHKSFIGALNGVYADIISIS
jgi:nicotinamidase-related amidase